MGLPLTLTLFDLRVGEEEVVPLVLGLLAVLGELLPQALWLGDAVASPLADDATEAVMAILSDAQGDPEGAALGEATVAVAAPLSDAQGDSEAEAATLADATGDAVAAPLSDAQGDSEAEVATLADATGDAVAPPLADDAPEAEALGEASGVASPLADGKELLWLLELWLEEDEADGAAVELSLGSPDSEAKGLSVAPCRRRTLAPMPSASLSKGPPST